MKKTLLTVALVTASLAAFAQGKVKMISDGGNLMQLGGNVMAADAADANSPVPTTGPLPSGVVLEVGLFVGTSSSSLSLATTSIINPAGGSGLPAGSYASKTTVLALAGATAGQLTYMQLWAWDSAYSTPLLAEAAGSYFGSDNVFTMNPSTGIAYASINASASPYNSTWAAAGDENPLIIQTLIPEPTTFALAGLGAAALVIFRRRK